ncbi:MAG: hypothetical protein IPO67_29160 [Deltaproteobacteria bacterium]|nr:hypothetical protein [Deltaproteobacteria bacterium]
MRNLSWMLLRLPLLTLLACASEPEAPVNDPAPPLTPGPGGAPGAGPQPGLAPGGPMGASQAEDLSTSWRADLAGEGARPGGRGELPRRRRRRLRERRAVPEHPRGQRRL